MSWEEILENQVSNFLTPTPSEAIILYRDAPYELVLQTKKNQDEWIKSYLFDDRNINYTNFHKLSILLFLQTTRA